LYTIYDYTYNIVRSQGFFGDFLVHPVNEQADPTNQVRLQLIDLAYNRENLNDFIKTRSSNLRPQNTSEGYSVRHFGVVA
jgi:hypothetical protein